MRFFVEVEKRKHLAETRGVRSRARRHGANDDYIDTEPCEW